MKYRLMKCNDKIHLLLFNGELKILTTDEARRYVFNFDSIEFPDEPDEMSLFDDYKGIPLVSLDDNGTLVVHNAQFIRELATPSEFPYLTVPEYADKYGKKTSIVRRLCLEGRLEGAVQRGATWYIPMDTPYPADGRAGRDMSKRYQKKD